MLVAHFNDYARLAIYGHHDYWFDPQGPQYPFIVMGHGKESLTHTVQ